MKTSSQFPLIAAACRYNTGSSILDSGSAYGRWHERPLPEPELPPVCFEAWGKGSGKFDDRAPDITATIHTSHFLNEQFSLRPELAAQLDEFAEKADAAAGEFLKPSWFELGTQFMESLGYQQLARDNTYNNECDLDQNFVWEVWWRDEFAEPLEDDDGNVTESPEEFAARCRGMDNPDDWVYAEGCVVLLYVHTGCDVRGGYGKPLIAESNSSDYSTAIDFVAQVYAESGEDSEGLPLNDNELRRLDEHWSCGYSSAPVHQFCKDVGEIVEWPGNDAPESARTRIRVRLKSGETIWACAALPWT